MTTTTQILTAVGPGAPVCIKGTEGRAPTILCLVSPGASLSYNIEVTGTPTIAENVLPDSAIWFPFDNAAIGLTASQNAEITGVVTAIRMNITQRSAGALTFQLVQ